MIKFSLQILHITLFTEFIRKLDRYYKNEHTIAIALNGPIKYSAGVFTHKSVGILSATIAAPIRM